jgi:uncharacterized protein YcfJ
MKFNILNLIAMSFIVIASSAYADTSYKVQGHVVSIDPVYTNISQKQPYQSCQNVDVPIYGRQGGGDAGGSALLGMIIGGISGKAITGKDNGAAAGAVIGGIIGANNAQKGQQVVTGYRTERQCTTDYSYVNTTVINEYDITYNINGRSITFRVNRAQGERARVGQQKQFRVSYQFLN